MAKTARAEPMDVSVVGKSKRKPDYVLRIRQPPKWNTEKEVYEQNENYITVASLWSMEYADKRTGEMVQGFGVRFHLRTIELGSDAGGILVPFREADAAA